jgi:hypothetical protein
LSTWRRIIRPKEVLYNAELLEHKLRSQIYTVQHDPAIWYSITKTGIRMKMYTAKHFDTGQPILLNCGTDKQYIHHIHVTNTQGIIEITTTNGGGKI